MSRPADQSASDPASVRDSREAFVPGDPLGMSLSGESIARTAGQGDPVAAIARAGIKSPQVNPDHQQEADAGLLVSMLLLIAGLALLGLWLHRRRGRFNFAGHDGNR